jgi:hypothetical protein
VYIRHANHGNGIWDWNPSLGLQQPQDVMDSIVLHFLIEFVAPQSVSMQFLQA